MTPRVSAQPEVASGPENVPAHGVRPLDEPKVKAAHDAAGALVKRLRKILPQVRLDAERERHFFKMICVSEHAWAGLLKNVDAATADINRTEEYCKKYGV